MPKMVHRKTISRYDPTGKLVWIGMTPLKNLPDHLGNIILVPDSLGECFWDTSREVPFYTPVWMKME